MRQQQLVDGAIPHGSVDVVLLTMALVDSVSIISRPPGRCQGCGCELSGWPEKPQWISQKDEHVCGPCHHEAIRLTGSDYFRMEHELEVLARCWDDEAFNNEPKPGLLKRAWRRLKRLRSR